ncbi:Crp/Fnr family transcriptional regulator [Celerinatantimonas sp. YJH-8]|uniref:Crp/Fnr family transcriptional regulator n=1 Tax=Celerinatantimonas sp. YJH-8 TaxID=3228714 RepID=UPI0038BE4E98
MDKKHFRELLAAFFEQYQTGIDWSLLTIDFQMHTLKKGECFFNQGDIPQRMYFLGKGLVRYYSVAESGKEYTHAIAKAPRLIGSTRAMTINQPSPFSIQALDDCLGISFSWNVFYEQMSQDLAFVKAYAKFLETIFLFKELKECAMVTHSATRRYLDFCNDFPELKNTLPKQQIASYIGITPVALSRIRAQLKFPN